MLLCEKVFARLIEQKGEPKTWQKILHFALGPKFQVEKWVLLLSYLYNMMRALNTLNESMQGKHHTMIEFVNKLHAFKEKLELCYTKMKKFASFPILNRSIEDLDSESDLMTSVSLISLERAYTL